MVKREQPESTQLDIADITKEDLPYLIIDFVDSRMKIKPKYYTIYVRFVYFLFFLYIYCDCFFCFCGIYSINNI